MKTKKTLTVILMIVLVFSSMVPVLAKSQSEKGTSIGIIWDEETGKTTYYDLDNPLKDKPIHLDKQPSNEDIENAKKKKSDISPQALMPVLIRYDQDSARINYEAEYVGFTRVDNSKNLFTPASIIFIADDTDSFSASTSATYETGLELDAIVAKVQATVTIGGTVKREWTAGHSYGAESSVPPREIGRITAYIPGTYSAGTLVYKVYNTYDDSYFIDYVDIGATVPANHAWNLKVEIPSE